MKNCKNAGECKRTHCFDSLKKGNCVTSNPLCKEIFNRNYRATAGRLIKIYEKLFRQSFRFIEHNNMTICLERKQKVISNVFRHLIYLDKTYNYRVKVS